MNESIKQNWFKVSLFVVVTLVLIISFYWFEYIPYEARKECVKVAVEKATEIGGDQTDARYYAWKCLMNKGLEH